MLKKHMSMENLLSSVIASLYNLVGNKELERRAGVIQEAPLGKSLPCKSDGLSPEPQTPCTFIAGNVDAGEFPKLAVQQVRVNHSTSRQ